MTCPQLLISPRPQPLRRVHRSPPSWPICMPSLLHGHILLFLTLMMTPLRSNGTSRSHGPPRYPGRSTPKIPQASSHYGMSFGTNRPSTQLASHLVSIKLDRLPRVWLKEQPQSLL